MKRKSIIGIGIAPVALVLAGAAGAVWRLSVPTVGAQAVIADACEDARAVNSHLSTLAQRDLSIK